MTRNYINCIKIVDGIVVVSIKNKINLKGFTIN